MVLEEPRTKSDLVNEIDSSFSTLNEYLQAFPKEKIDQLIVGDYNYRDVIAHLYEWENFLVSSLVGISKNTLIPHKLNIKKMNREFYDRNKFKSIDEVMKLLTDSHQKLITYLKEFDEKLLGLPDPYYPEKHTVYTLAQHCSSLHYPWAIRFLKNFTPKA
ncbi:MAG: hypothetical protein ACD_22C00223G0006 [uncultured bacterium]|nr:MAG: hypothetical protein ACD_22C00223G0006 [uncultured bacterium]